MILQALQTYGPVLGPALFMFFIVFSWGITNVRKEFRTTLTILYMQLIEKEYLTTRHAIEAKIFDEQESVIGKVKEML